MKNDLTLGSLFRICAHHRVEEFAPPLAADEEREWQLLLVVALQLASCEILEELVYRAGAVVSAAAASCGLRLACSTLDNLQKLIKLNHL